MALPPFNINQSVPGDSDIVSQYPVAERLFRDIVESWFLVDGNNMGRLNKASLDFQTNAPTGTANVTTIWANETGALNARVGTSPVLQLTVPVGTMLEYSLPALPEGYIWANGQPVTSTYPVYRAALIAAGNPYGTDGTNPLRPDRREKVGAGLGTMGGTSSPGLLDNASTLGGVQGNKSVTLTEAQIPAHTHTATVTDPGHNHTVASGVAFTGSSGGVGMQAATQTTSTSVTGVTVTVNATGGGLGHPNVQPTIILNYIIRAV